MTIASYLALEDSPKLMQLGKSNYFANKDLMEGEKITQKAEHFS